MRHLHRATRTVAALLAVASSAACETTGAPARVEAPADSAAGEVAFELAGPTDAAIIVPVFINGQGPFDFVLDTGATLTCLDAEASRRLELPERRGAIGMGAGVGGAGRMRLVRIDSIRVGSARAEDLTGCEVDLRHAARVGVDVDGLLGLNFLKPFRVTLDFQREVLILHEP
ncbi:MAG TPA: retropepsin-like aspartic protease [Longimicrobiaceae bacterium]|nr:retropepsin-like aspartic protease [Longimicrobiaceae bacterium]